MQYLEHTPLLVLWSSPESCPHSCSHGCSHGCRMTHAYSQLPGTRAWLCGTLAGQGAWGSSRATTDLSSVCAPSQTAQTSLHQVHVVCNVKWLLSGVWDLNKAHLQTIMGLSEHVCTHKTPMYPFALRYNLCQNRTGPPFGVFNASRLGPESNMALSSPCVPQAGLLN